jgi:zinc/manganese transport system substrate-binding protein
MLRRAVLFATPLLLTRPVRAQQRPSVVASFSILSDMTRQIGGDRIALRAIAGPDQDAHGFHPKPSEATTLANAAVVIRNGLGFEGWLDRMIRSSGFKGALVTTTDGITPRMMEAHHHHHGHDHGALGDAIIIRSGRAGRQTRMPGRIWGSASTTSATSPLG